MSRPRLIALLLGLATLLVFLPVGGFSFVNYDDNEYVTDNSFVKNGLTWPDIRWAFTAFHAGNWHPLTWMSHMLDCQLFGANAGAHHFVNILIHALNVALLFTWLLRFTGKMGAAALMAALFAWHPLHVESVAWISERKDVLSTFFALTALLAYTHYVQAKVRAGFWLAWLCFALGLLAKPMLVTLPCILLLLDFWPFKRCPPLKAAIIIEKLPFFALSAASCVVTFLAQKQGEAVVSLQTMSMFYRLENAPVAILEYLAAFFVPINLCVIYPLREQIPLWEVAFAVMILMLISFVAGRYRISRPYLLMGWLWFLGTLLPVIGLVQVGNQSMADRYTYIPSIGFFIALVFLLAEMAERLQTPRVIVAGAAVMVCLACILITEHQLTFWRDSETLFRRAVAVTRDNSVALINLGVALDVQARYAEALPVYQQAERLEDSARRNFQVHNNLGNILNKLGQPARSLVEYRAALHLRPNDPALHNSVGTELTALGRYDEAMQEFSEANRLDPQYPWAYMEQAKVMFGLGRDAAAIGALNAALRVAPDDYQILTTTAHYLAANADSQSRDGKMALTLATRASALSGNHQPVVFDVLGMALAGTGDFTNAQNCAQNAIDIGTLAQMKNLDQYQQRLEMYRKGLPWRESFRFTNSMPLHEPASN